MKRITTDCCIVGAGPAGAVLAYLLSRNGVNVVLLEAQEDFEREFRGDTLHPSVMEIMAELDLATKILELPHVKVRQLSFNNQGEKTVVADFDKLRTDYPYITVMPQSRFLEFMTDQTEQFSNFQLLMKTKAVELIQNKDGVQGVVAHSPSGDIQIKAQLVVGCDGRYSSIRKLAEMELKKTAVPMDIFWFKLKKLPKDMKIDGVTGNIVGDTIFAQIDRGDYWQLGIVVPKGSQKRFHEEGLDSFQKQFATVAPHFKNRVKEIKDWKDMSYFMIECGRVEEWYKKGLLLIGDAAHVMSPVGGVGINYAIQDAVVSANVLSKPLLEKELNISHLARVQKKRIIPTKLVQWFQSQAHRFIIARALKNKQSFQAPWFARLPGMRWLLVRFIGIGLWRVHV